MSKKIYIELTNYCPLDCAFCPNKEVQQNKNWKKDFITIENFNKIINICVDEGIYDFGLTPRVGEVPYHPMYIELLNIINNNKKVKSFHFFTNSLLLYKIPESIGEINKLTLHISLNGLTDEEFKHLNNTTHPIDNSIDNIFKLSKIINIKVFYKSKHNLNSKQINPKIKIKLKSIEPKVIKVGHLNNWNNFSKSEETLKNRDKFIETTCPILKEKNMILSNGDFILCGCRDPLGETKIGNIFDTPLKEILDSKEYKITPKLCKNCTGAY